MSHHYDLEVTVRTLFLSGQGRAMGSAGAQLIPPFQLPHKPCPLCPFRRVLGKCSAAIAPTCLLVVHYYLHGNVSKDMEALICTYRQGLSHRPYDPHDLSRSHYSSKENKTLLFVLFVIDTCSSQLSSVMF